MCFSQPASAGFCIMALTTAAILRARGHPGRRYQLFLYFAAMEAIQFCAYSVAGQCDNPWNKVLTMAAYLHLMYQNIAVNRFFLCPENGVHPDVSKLVLWMCFIGGTLGWFVSLPWPVWLGASPQLLDALAEKFPELRSYSLAGTEDACRFESMCGPQVCTFNTRNHIAWSVPVLPPSYYLPSGHMHCFFFFVPTLVMTNNMARLTMLGAFLTGPVFTQILAARHMDTYKFEWPATWCFMSVAQCVIALAIELYGLYAVQKRDVSSSPANRSNGHHAKAEPLAAAKANGSSSPDAKAADKWAIKASKVH